MRSSAISDAMAGGQPDAQTTGSRGRAVVLGAVALAAVAAGPRPAAAQSCKVPALNDQLCAGKQGTIDNYIECYGDLYDMSVIPAFEAIASCSQVKARKGLQATLESAAALITGKIESALALINATLSQPNNVISSCVGGLNLVQQSLQTFLDGERTTTNANELDAYRRAHYGPDTLTFIEGVLLTARQSRAACDGPLQQIRGDLAALRDLKAHQLDYCQVLRQSANYESVSHIDALAQWTPIDPSIHFDQYFDLSISLNSQCGYYDFSTGAAGVRTSSCSTATVQYAQTLSKMDGVLGWLARNRNSVISVSTAVATTIFGLAGYGSSAGPYGALVGLGVGLVIGGLEYISLQNDIDELNDLIASKERELREVVQANLITEDEFANLITELCTPWKTVIDQRIDDMLARADLPQHLQTIDGYYALSDQLNNWYNGLFQWAITPGADGTRFLDTLAQESLLQQKSQFDQQIAGARALQEVAAQKTTLTDTKGNVTVLACANLTGKVAIKTRSTLNANVLRFNSECLAAMDAVAVQPDQAVAFADSTVEPTVICSYDGFRNDVASLEIVDGDGFASNMTLKDPSGAVLAQFPNVTSDTDFTQGGFPGFSCADPAAGEFGKSAKQRIAAATYPLHVQANVPGLRDSDAAGLRTDVQTLDSQLRLKVNSCARQLGITVSIPRPATACGIPTI